MHHFKSDFHQAFDRAIRTLRKAYGREFGVNLDALTREEARQHEEGVRPVASPPGVYRPFRLIDAPVISPTLHSNSNPIAMNPFLHTLHYRP